MSQASRNARRFFRIDMPLQTYVTSSSPIIEREIFASGANYLPVSIVQKLHQEKLQVLDSLAGIKEHKEALTEIFNEMLNQAEFFGECCQMMFKGLNPHYHLASWAKLKNLKQGFVKLKLLQDDAPKTYAYLKKIEEKFLYFVHQLMLSAEHSSADQFYAPNYLKKDFRIDQLVEAFSETQYQASPLPQSILHSAVFINTYLDVFRRMHDDHTQSQHPEDWPFEWVNISASGLAVSIKKGFRLHERVDVRVYLADAKRILKFDGVVVQIQTDTETQIERVAINFEFPDGQSQQFLQTYIQKYEINQCLTASHS